MAVSMKQVLTLNILKIIQLCGDLDTSTFRAWTGYKAPQRLQTSQCRSSQRAYQLLPTDSSLFNKYRNICKCLSRIKLCVVLLCTLPLVAMRQRRTRRIFREACLQLDQYLQGIKPWSRCWVGCQQPQRARLASAACFHLCVGAGCQHSHAISQFQIMQRLKENHFIQWNSRVYITC